MRVAVVGAGIAGLAAADALVQRDADVVCFERGVPGGGQSAGETRVFRHVHELAEHTRLVARARAAWDAWEARAGRTLTGREGVLFAGPDVNERAAHLAAAGIEHRLVDGDELQALHPLVAAGVDRALHDPGGGASRARRTIETLAGWLGDRLVRAEVIGLDADGGGVVVQASEGLWRCDRAVVCAGVESGRIAAALGVEIPIRVSAHLRGTFPVRPEHRGRPLPCWLDRTGVFGERVYSGPLGSSGLYGVGLADDAAPMDAVDRLRAYVARALPGLEPEPVATRVCHVTVLPWASDAFALWQGGPVTILAGHNLFKFAPLVGAWLADVALGGPIPPELRPC